MSTSQQLNPGLAAIKLPNQPNGFVQIDGNGDVLGTFAQRRDTAANIAAIVLKDGELAFTTDTKETFIGDGTAAGGLFVSQQWQIKSQNWASGAIPAFIADGSSDSGNAIVFPCVRGGLYKVRSTAVFAGSDTNANFALASRPQGGVDVISGSAGNLRYVTSSLWSGAGFSEASFYSSTSSSGSSSTNASSSLGVTANQAATAANVTQEAIFRVSATAINYLIAIHPFRRLSGVESAATAKIIAECRRIG